MKKNEKYSAIIFDIINYDKDLGILIYKPKNIALDCKVNFNNDKLILPNGKELYSMEDRKIVKDGLKKCYGYPLPLSDIKKINEENKKNNIDSKLEDIIADTYKDLFYNIYFGTYDKKNDKENIKIILADKLDVKNYADSSWFYNFQSEDDDEFFDDLGDNDIYLSLPSSTILNIISMLKKERNLKLIDYFNRAYNFLISDSIDINNIPILEDDFKDEGKKNYEEAINDSKIYLKELNELVGLDNVKNFANSLRNYLLFLKKVEKNTNLTKPSLHMLFTGNPGTGKTTVARIISNLLYSFGFTYNDNFSEITTKELIGNYVGETAQKTSKFLKEHKGGVIFIDEAYTFSDPAQEYGDEALAEILKEMEKGDTTFIFAGYKKEMLDFIDMNSGLESRIRYFVDFKDYTDEELLSMFKNKVSKTKMKLEDGAEKEILNIIDKAKNNKNFGNGRFIDKLFEKIIFEHANNTLKYRNKDKLITITKNDIDENMINDLMFKKGKTKTIGFSNNKKDSN